MRLSDRFPPHRLGRGCRGQGGEQPRFDRVNRDGDAARSRWRPYLSFSTSIGFVRWAGEGSRVSPVPLRPSTGARPPPTALSAP